MKEVKDFYNPDSMITTIRKKGYFDRIDKSGVFVEIGIERGEGSTQIFWKECTKLGIEFYTVDQHPERCREFKKEHPDINVFNQTGEDFLRMFKLTGKKISAAYLDNFDWMWEPGWHIEGEAPNWIQKQIDEYAELGVEMNNKNCQIAHLHQAILIEEMSTDTCLIMCDDTFTDQMRHTYSGKCGPTISYLLAKSFEILYEKPNGIAMGRNI